MNQPEILMLTNDFFNVRLFIINTIPWKVKKNGERERDFEEIMINHDPVDP